MIGNITSFKEFRSFTSSQPLEGGSHHVVCSKTYLGLLLLHIINHEINHKAAKVLFVVKNVKELLKLKNYIEYNFLKLAVYQFRGNQYHGDSKSLQQKDIGIERLEVFSREALQI